MARKLIDYPRGVIRVLKRKKIHKHNQAALKNYKHEDIYYIMRPEIENCGLASMMRCVLSHAKYVDEQGFRLVVDFRKRINPYLLPEEIGKTNAWDYYFKQPGGAYLEDVEKLPNVIQVEESELSIAPSDSMEFFTNANCIAFWRKIYKKYIQLSDEAELFIAEQRKIVFGQRTGKVLGCVARGTDYMQGRPYNHPVQPKPEEVIEKAKQVMAEYGYTNIFLATEDENILNQFRENFGDKLLFVQQQRYCDGKEKLACQKNFATETDRKTEGMKYLSAIYLLSECDALIGGRCGITTMAYIISEGFTFEYLWNLGRYCTEDYCLPEEYL